MSTGSPPPPRHQTIKKLEAGGKSRGEVMDALMKKFGEQNPDVGTVSK